MLPAEEHDYMMYCEDCGQKFYGSDAWDSTCPVCEVGVHWHPCSEAMLTESDIAPYIIPVKHEPSAAHFSA